MAKRRSSSRRRRVAYAYSRHYNANRRLPTTFSSPRSITYPGTGYLIQTEDRRTFHPEGSARPARSRFQSFHRLEVTSPRLDPWRDYFSTPRSLPTTVAFKSAPNVLVCVRRKIRKEVLHAIKKAGRRGQKAPRRSAYSDIQC